ncbi:MAG: glutamate synthase small subunit [Elusimicrobia bacterium]|nr:glutamate synthase small subunit [Elusimicrobiota bacterium]MBD3412563.1 glutamate synthase small subunit [Elusimicrobiota bacterium]
MADPQGFMKIKRQPPILRPICERLKDFKDVNKSRSAAMSKEQASRCMDCGIPFCHWACPVGNYIPEWNDLIFQRQWERAFELLDATNNLPEITGRVCPAPCEYSCVLGINDDPVTIKENEKEIIEYAFKHKYIKPRPPAKRTGKRVAVIGSGPAGLSCAQQLNRAGHQVVVFEKDDQIGGILWYGIPNFKLEKWIVDRRVKLLRDEGIEFRASKVVGKDFPVSQLVHEFNAVCLTIGSRVPRDLPIEGRKLGGIHFAMDYLTQVTRKHHGAPIAEDELINAKGKNMVIIGGGDTGADCVGTANRQNAACVVQIELLERPAACRTDAYPWPLYPLLLKTSTSHEEGADRQWSVMTKRFVGEKGQVKKLECIRVEFKKTSAQTCPQMQEIPGSEFEIPADLVILAIGFTGPEPEIIAELNLEKDNRGNIKTGPDYMTSRKPIFAAGDARRGQSLIVWAISEGRKAACSIDRYLMGSSNLPNF